MYYISTNNRLEWHRSNFWLAFCIVTHTLLNWLIPLHLPASRSGYAEIMSMWWYCFKLMTNFKPTNWWWNFHCMNYNHFFKICLIVYALYFITSDANTFFPKFNNTLKIISFHSQLKFMDVLIYTNSFCWLFSVVFHLMVECLLQVDINNS